MSYICKGHPERKRGVIVNFLGGGGKGVVDLFWNSLIIGKTSLVLSGLKRCKNTRIGEQIIPVFQLCLVGAIMNHLPLISM